MVQVGDHVMYESRLGYSKYGIIKAVGQHEYNGEVVILACVQWHGPFVTVEPMFADQLTVFEPLEV